MSGFLDGGTGDRAADIGCRFIDLHASFGTVVNLDFKQVLAGLRRRQNALQMFGRKYDAGIELDLAALWFRKVDRQTPGTRFPCLANDGLGGAAIDAGLHLEVEIPAIGVLESRRMHVRNTGGSFSRLQFRELAEILDIAIASGAGEVESDTSMRGRW